MRGRVLKEMFVRVIIRVLCECFRCVYRVSGFEPIDRDCVSPTLLSATTKYLSL